MPEGPWHGAECQLVSHSTYERRRPEGARVRRFLRPRCGWTVSLLPDCLATHLSGTMSEVEATVHTAEQAPSLAAAVRQARPGRIEQPGAERWTLRRLRRVQECLELPRTLEPARFGAVAPTLGAFGAALGTVAVLVRLRTVAAARLGTLPTPVRFRTARKKAARAACEKTARAASAKKQHETGLDLPGHLSSDFSTRMLISHWKRLLLALKSQSVL